MKVIILTDSTDTEFLVATKKIFRTIFQKVIVKPLPKRLDDIPMVYYASGKPYISENDDYKEGWNDCVDYIEKEDDEPNDFNLEGVK